MSLAACRGIRDRVAAACLHQHVQLKGVVLSDFMSGEPWTKPQTNGTRGTTFPSVCACPEMVMSACAAFHSCSDANLVQRRENEGLLTTSPCDTTFHPIKGVKVLLPSV